MSSPPAPPVAPTPASALHIDSKSLCFGLQGSIPTSLADEDEKWLNGDVDVPMIEVVGKEGVGGDDSKSEQMAKLLSMRKQLNGMEKERKSGIKDDAKI